MKNNRRHFLKHAALGSAALSSLGGFSVFGVPENCDPVVSENKINGLPGRENKFNEWQISLNEQTSELTIKNGPVSLKGILGFISDNKKWSVAKSRDGIADRFAIVDTQANVQGYFVFLPNGEQLQLMFYHRTAQDYRGKMSFTGEITFPFEGFACRTRSKDEERVLSLFTGMADFMTNDSIFAPENDTILRLNSSELDIRKAENGSYAFEMSGRIDLPSQAIFSINLENSYFRNRYVPYYHPIDRKRAPKAPTGWMSWNTYFDTATADDNLAEAKTGQKYLQPFGCEIWHIESWQDNSDKLPVRNFYNMNLETSKNKFPKGMKKLADDIRKLGFRPGIWMAPFGTGNTDFYNGHKDWFLHDKDGKPISCWNGRYTLDPTVPDAREHLRKIFQIASRDWGYEYFKIDGMSGRSQGYCAHLYERPEIRARFKDPSCPNPFELCIKAFRDGMGEDRIMLACQGHTSGPDALYADASRIGADIVHPNQPVQWSGVVNQGRCFVNQAFTHNIVTYADPDTLLVRDLPMEEARVSATVVALPGQLTFFGDKFAGMAEEKMKLLQQTLPPADIRPASLYPYFSILPVWNLRVKNRKFEDYNVVGLFNWDNEAKKISFSTTELGIDSEPEYTLFEFWTQKDLGNMKNNFEMEVPAHSVRLLAMHKMNEIPQWISSDRHITQTGVELKEYKWNVDRKAIEGKIELIGTFPLTMHIRVPAGFNLATAVCNGAPCSVQKQSDNIFAVTFLSKKTGEFDFSIQC